MTPRTMDEFFAAFPLHVKATILPSEGTDYIFHNPCTRIQTTEADSYMTKGLHVMRWTGAAGTNWYMLLPITDRFYTIVDVHDPFVFEWWIVREGELRPRWRLRTAYKEVRQT